MKKIKTTYLQLLATSAFAVSPLLNHNLNANIVSDEVYYGPSFAVAVKQEQANTFLSFGPILPLHQYDGKLAYFTASFATNTKGTLGGNLGFGYRNMSQDSIYGVYGYIDQTHTSKLGLFNQITVGLEWLMPTYGLRVNAYSPGSRKAIYSVDNQLQAVAVAEQAASVTKYTSKKYEQSLPGFDVSAEYAVPQLAGLTITGSVYHFGFREKVKAKTGAGIALAYDLASNINLVGNASYDNMDKTNVSIGLRASFGVIHHADLNNKHKVLHDKMLSMPVRNLAIVFGESTETTETNLGQLNISDNKQTLLIVESMPKDVRIVTKDTDGNLRISANALTKDELVALGSKAKEVDITLMTDHGVSTYRTGAHDPREFQEAMEMSFDPDTASRFMQQLYADHDPAARADTASSGHSVASEDSAGVTPVNLTPDPVIRRSGMLTHTPTAPVGSDSSAYVEGAGASASADGPSAYVEGAGASASADGPSAYVEGAGASASADGPSAYVEGAGDGASTDGPSAYVDGAGAGASVGQEPRGHLAGVVESTQTVWLEAPLGQRTQLSVNKLSPVQNRMQGTLSAVIREFLSTRIHPGDAVASAQHLLLEDSLKPLTGEVTAHLSATDDYSDHEQHHAPGIMPLMVSPSMGRIILLTASAREARKSAVRDLNAKFASM